MGPGDSENGVFCRCLKVTENYWEIPRDYAYYLYVNASKAALPRHMEQVFLSPEKKLKCTERK